MVDNLKNKSMTGREKVNAGSYHKITEESVYNALYSVYIFLDFNKLTCYNFF